MQELHSEIARLSEGMSWVKDNLTELRREVKDLNSFKWRVTGAAVIVSVIISAVFQLFMKGE